jgi:hypothetical protein
MPMPPAADQANNSLREALVRRGYVPDDRGALSAPLWELPDTGGEVRRLAQRGERLIELPPGEDHALSDEAWAVLTASPPSYDEYREL